MAPLHLHCPSSARPVQGLRIHRFAEKGVDKGVRRGWSFYSKKSKIQYLPHGDEGIRLRDVRGLVLANMAFNTGPPSSFSCF